MKVNALRRTNNTIGSNLKMVLFLISENINKKSKIHGEDFISTTIVVRISYIQIFEDLFKSFFSPEYIHPPCHSSVMNKVCIGSHIFLVDSFSMIFSFICHSDDAIDLVAPGSVSVLRKK